MENFQISLELRDHSSYKIFLFPRGWFYDKRTQQKLEFVDVRKGENVKIQLSLQVKSAKTCLFGIFFPANAETSH